MEIKKLNRTGMQVFGVDLDDVEKDEEFVNVPKFVVECIKIIELEENMQTNGIYRASGKKDSIDKLRKKVGVQMILKIPFLVIDFNRDWTYFHRWMNRNYAEERNTCHSKTKTFTQ